MENEQEPNGRSKPDAERTHAEGGRSALDERFRARKWQALIPAAVGVAILLLGYYLDAQVLRIIGMIIVGIVLVLLC